MIFLKIINNPHIVLGTYLLLLPTKLPDNDKWKEMEIFQIDKNQKSFVQIFYLLYRNICTIFLDFFY